MAAPPDSGGLPTGHHSMGRGKANNAGVRAESTQSTSSTADYHELLALRVG